MRVKKFCAILLCFVIVFAINIPSVFALDERMYLLFSARDFDGRERFPGDGVLLVLRAWESELLRQKTR